MDTKIAHITKNQINDLTPCFQIYILNLRTSSRLISQKIGSSLRGFTVQSFCDIDVLLAIAHGNHFRVQVCWYANLLVCVFCVCDEGVHCHVLNAS